MPLLTHDDFSINAVATTRTCSHVGKLLIESITSVTLETGPHSEDNSMKIINPGGNNMAMVCADGSGVRHDIEIAAGLGCEFHWLLDNADATVQMGFKRQDNADSGDHILGVISRGIRANSAGHSAGELAIYTKHSTTFDFVTQLDNMFGLGWGGSYGNQLPLDGLFYIRSAASGANNWNMEVWMRSLFLHNNQESNHWFPVWCGVINWSGDVSFGVGIATVAGEASDPTKKAWLTEIKCGSDYPDPGPASRYRCIGSAEDVTDNGYVTNAPVYDPVLDRYIVAYLKGTAEAANDLDVIFKKSDDADRLVWDEIQDSGNPMFEATGTYRYHDIAFSTDGTGTIVAFVTKWLIDNSKRTVEAKVSSDGGETWGSEITIYDDATHTHMHASNNGIYTSRGRWIMACHNQADEVFLMWSDEALPDAGADWTTEEAIKTDAHETSLIELKTGPQAGKILCLSRDPDGQYCRYFLATATPTGFTYGFQVEMDGKSGRPLLENGRDPLQLIEAFGSVYLLGNIANSRFRNELSMWKMGAQPSDEWTRDSRSPIYTTRQQAPEVGVVVNGKEIFVVWCGANFGDRNGVFAIRDLNFFAPEALLDAPKRRLRNRLI